MGYREIAILVPINFCRAVSRRVCFSFHSLALNISIMLVTPEIYRLREKWFDIFGHVAKNINGGIPKIQSGARGFKRFPR